MESKKWVSSKEAKNIAKLQDCDLMHHREAGKIRFTKKGNAYYYNKMDLLKSSNKGSNS